MRVTSNRWDGERVVFWDQVLEDTGVDGRLHCKEGTPAGRWDPPIEPYGSYGAGVEVIEVGEVETRYPQQSPRREDGGFPVGDASP